MDYRTAPASIEGVYRADPERYSRNFWRPLGESGLKINPITVGTWQNFSDLDPRASVRDLYLGAFDRGIFTFDFANNYGRPPGSAESLFGSLLRDDLKPYRRELVISTKAGYDMWPGPNGVGSSAKYLISSLDESLKRLNLDYVDIFYSHRYDPSTPIEETAEALDYARRSGRCLYVGISSYPVAKATEITDALERRGTKLSVNQSHYNMLTRWTERDVLDLSRDRGTGFAAFSPLAQGLLSEKYLEGETAHGRAANKGTSVVFNDWPRLQRALGDLKKVAAARGQTIPQMALSWVLRRPEVSTAVVGVRTLDQLSGNMTLNSQFDDEEEQEIARICAGVDVDLWKGSSEGQ